VPLSPFTARLSLAAFLAIATGVGTNLLYMQPPQDHVAERSARTQRARAESDAERLRRLALDATTEPAAAAARAPQARAAAPAPPRAGRRTQEPQSAGAAHRIGSFAPSSGMLAPAALPGADPGEARRATIRSIQAELARRGYEPGPADGQPGLVTRAAVLAYEHDQGLPLTAEPSPEVLAHLRHGTSAPGAAIGLDGDAAHPAQHAEQVIRAVQQALGQLGYLTARPDGLANEETVRAIREFEMDVGLVPSGRISGPLVARLNREAAARRPAR